MAIGWAGTWEIGDEEKDDGVLLIVAPNERKVRIETGYGARVFLTDAVSSVIIRNSILPRFKADDYAGGIAAGADADHRDCSSCPRPKRRGAPRRSARPRRSAARSAGSNPVPVFMIVIIFFVVIRSMRAARRRRALQGRERGGGIDPLVVLWGLDAISRSGARWRRLGRRRLGRRRRLWRRRRFFGRRRVVRRRRRFGGMVMRSLNAEDHAKVSAAIAAAEANSDGEIVAIASRRSRTPITTSGCIMRCWWLFATLALFAAVPGC